MLAVQVHPQQFEIKKICFTSWYEPNHKLSVFVSKPIFQGLTLSMGIFETCPAGPIYSLVISVYKMLP